MIQPVWSTRTGQAQDAFLQFSETIQDDMPFLVHDLHGSAAHVMGLQAAGLLDDGEAQDLLAGLARLKDQVAAGTWTPDPALEDIHMNIEAHLTAELGGPGQRLHTGRSRNDQVATCITLYTRQALADIAAAAHSLAAHLAAQAEAHAGSPWLARTHGQPAQPATLGFLLAGHAFRVHEIAKDALHAFHAVGESPLGSGAVAGSSLPLDPDHTAQLLGLRPPRNAALAAGTRDTVLRALGVADHAGTVVASLAQDLLDLFHDKTMRLGDGLTTGSSLMPQKRNPDVLELVRGLARSLPGLHAQATAIVAPLGLGYQRDMQLTKPLLTKGMDDLLACLEMASATVQSATFDPHRHSLRSRDPMVLMTDAAEALVADGMPFRQAYTLMTHIAAELEKAPAAQAGPGIVAEASVKAAVAAHGEGAEAATILAALLPSLGAPASTRATTGGPAPAAVTASLQRFHACHETIDVQIQAAQTAAAQPADLLEAA